MEQLPEQSAPTSERHNRPRRRWFQYSIRTLLILTLATAVALTIWVVPAVRQREAIRALTFRTVITYDYQEKDGTIEYPPHVPRWLVDLVGVDLFADVVQVELIHATEGQILEWRRSGNREELKYCSNGMTDLDLAHFAAFKKLRFLDLRETSITDAGLAQIAELRRLEILMLNETQVSDQGLFHLRNLTSLKSLHLDETLVTGTGLAHLKNLNCLQRLGLHGAPLTSDGVRQVAQLVNLNELYFSSTNLTDQDLLPIQFLKNLQSLGISGACDLTDAGLHTLAELPNLQYLGLEWTKVTDAGLAPLSNNKNLIWFDINGNHITEAGLSKLRDRMRKCEINGLKWGEKRRII